MKISKEFILGLIVFDALAIAVFAFFFLFLTTKDKDTGNFVSLGGYIFNENPASRPKSDDGKIKILFGGDLMFDRYIRENLEKNGTEYVLGNLRERLREYDLVLANLEGPITDNKSVSVGSKIGSTENYIFTFDASTAEILKDYNIKLVNIGNNHILNFGQEGLNQTMKYLKKGGVEFFGYTGNSSLPTQENYITEGEIQEYNTKPLLIKDIKGIKVGFVNYNQFIEGGSGAALAEIEKAAQTADFLVVYTHWGVEYVQTANTEIQSLAHAFIDSGADVVIGSHPHVIQQSETYKDKKIYYSLGNFVMDQYFDENVKKGMLVEIEISTVEGTGFLQPDFTEYFVINTSDGKTSFL